MNKIFLIDAYALIFRAYYALIRAPRVNTKGVNTSAVFGFVNILEDVLKRVEPTHLAVVFDPPGGTFRHKEYEAYKAQRESTPEDIKIAVPLIKNILKAYNIPILEVSNYEADDVIGTVAKKMASEQNEVYMLTPDKDYGQLVEEHIFMYRPKYKGGYETVGVTEILEKYSLSNVGQMIDLLGLMGDTADNIPGCPGVGEKTAIKLLKEFGSIDNLLANTSQLKGAIKRKVEEHQEQIILSRYLATIKTDVPMNVEIDDLIIRVENEKVLRNLFEELEFRTIIAKKWGDSAETTKRNKQMSLFEDVKGKVEEVIAPTALNTINDTPHNYILVNTLELCNDLVRKLSKQQSVCFDTETTGIDVMNAQLIGLSFSWQKGEAYYVPLSAERVQSLEILVLFRPFFEDEKIEKIAQNIKFDMLMLRRYGIEIRGHIFDTMIAHYLLQPELRHGMDYLAETYLNYQTIHYEDLVGKRGKKQLSLRSVEVERVKDYAAEDADITFQLKSLFEKELEKAGLSTLFYSMEMPLVRVLVQMEINGVLIDAKALKESSEILTKELKNIEENIFGLCGMKFNVASPMQVGEVLFDKLKLDEKAKKTKTGQYSTAEDVLLKLKAKHPVVNQILEYRGLKKLLSTYIDALPQLLNPETGRIHTSYNQTTTATGRLSSTNPNLQNIPIRDTQGKEIRRAFIPDKGSLFISADYSQIELRLMAHLSHDANMIDAFQQGHDIHTATAAQIYKTTLGKVTSDMRRKAKTANFGIIYGISAFGLAERLEISRKEAKALIDGYFETYPDVKRYMKDVVEEAKKKGYVETIYGRKRYLNDINSKNSIVRSFAERNAVNAPIQGSAADIIKLVMIAIQQRLTNENLQAKMIMQVHDELNFTVPKAEVDSLKEIIVTEMENVLQLKVPLIAECGLGDNWLEAH